MRRRCVIASLFALVACGTRPTVPPVTVILPPVVPDPSATVRLVSAPVTPTFPARGDWRPLLEPSLATARAPDVFHARFTTSVGELVVEVHRNWAPHGADRFYNLVRIGFFDGTRFFRAIDGFIVQWGIHGDPAVSAAWHDASIKDDPNTHSNVRGTISFAKTSAPDTATTQVFVNYGDNARLDSMRFTPFGEIVEGMATLDAVYKGYAETPNQGKITSEGDRYLDGFPKMDRVLSARIDGE